MPIKEDVEMRSAGFNCCDVTALKVTEIWAAMVNSSPEPPVIPSPRITEQDAREIEDFLVSDYRKEYVGQGIENWIRSACRALLNKLNGDKNGK